MWESRFPRAVQFLRVVSNLADYSTSPGMTNEDDWTILHGDDPTGRIYVVRQRGQRVLNCDNVKAACFKDWNDFGPTRTVRKRSVNEHDILYRVLRRLCSTAAPESRKNCETACENSVCNLHQNLLVRCRFVIGSRYFTRAT